MPWLAIPFASRDAKNKLSAKFSVSGIPMLVVLNPDGTVKTLEGRAQVSAAMGIGRAGAVSNFSVFVGVIIICLFIYNTIYGNKQITSE